MEEHSHTYLKQAVKHWYLPFILGIVFMFLGIWVFRTPFGSFITLSVLFAVTFFITGVVELSFALANAKRLHNWGWSLASGIVDLLIGLLLISQPILTIVILPIYIGFAVMFRSIMTIGWSIELKKMGVSKWGTALLISIIGLLFSLIMLESPVIADLTIVVYTGLAFIVLGFFYIDLALKLRRVSKALQ